MCAIVNRNLLYAYFYYLCFPVIFVYQPGSAEFSKQCKNHVEWQTWYFNNHKNLNPLRYHSWVKSKSRVMINMSIILTNMATSARCRLWSGSYRPHLVAACDWDNLSAQYIPHWIGPIHVARQLIFTKSFRFW